MQKLILVLAIACLYQTSYSQLILKPLIGINITDASRDADTHEVNGKVGWQFGLSAVFGNKFYIEPGLTYQHKALDAVSNTDPEFDFEQVMTGIRVPVSIGIHLLGREKSNINIRLFGGGSGYFITSVKGDGITKDDISSPQWGVYAGAGIDFWMMFVDLKYEWSLTDISSITSFDIGQSRSFFLNTGFRFRF